MTSFFGNVFSTALQYELKSFSLAESIIYTKFIEKICIYVQSARHSLSSENFLQQTDSFGFFVERRREKSFRLFQFSVFYTFLQLKNCLPFISLWWKVISQWCSCFLQSLIDNQLFNRHFFEEDKKAFTLSNERYFTDISDSFQKVKSHVDFSNDFFSFF